MAYQVRQLSFGEILDQSFRVLRGNFKVLAGVMAVFYIPFSLLIWLVTPRLEAGVPPVPDTATILTSLAGSLVMMVFLPLSQLAASRAVSDAYLSTPTGVPDAYRAAFKLYFPYLTTCLLLGLALLGATLLFVIPGVYLGVCWALVGPVAVVEGGFGRAAMKRSRALVSGHWWRTLGVLFVAALIAGVVRASVNAVLGAIPLLGPLCTGAVQAVATAYSSTAVVVLYVDLRCRHEDFDLQLLATQVAAQTVTTAGVAGAVGT